MAAALSLSKGDPREQTPFDRLRAAVYGNRDDPKRRKSALWVVISGRCCYARHFRHRIRARGDSFLPVELETEQSVFMQIMVRDNNVDQALRALKKKLQREGVYREMKLRRHYEKPSEKRARERAAAVRRARKMDRKRAERDGVK
jgi:small subunit ribosomal protein S21